VTVKVQLLHTCLVNEIDPEVGMATVRVLERLGLEVEVPAAQTCCGQPAWNAGFPDEARAAARHTLSVLHSTAGPIVVPSGSCADMLVHQYDELFEEEPHWRERACAVAGRCRELSQFLVETLGGRPLGGRLQAKVAYHPSCHLVRGLGARTEAPELLRGIAEAELVDVADGDECCGFGGLFSVKNPEISGSMMERKLAAFDRAGAERVVSCDLGCLLHLAGGLRRRGSALRVQHLAQLLDEALP
jgi:L-lactate dehydrogenase complex protein LldE